MKVLKHYGYLEKGIPTNKGKAAALINSPYSLIVVELIERGCFRGLTPSELAGIMIAFVAESKATTARFKSKNIQIR